MKFYIKTINDNRPISIFNYVGLFTKPFILILLAFIAKGQSYNIPTPSQTNNSYVGTYSGDLNLKSTAGNLFLNTTGTSTTPNIGINTDGNVGIGVYPTVNPTSGYYNYQPTLVVKGVDGNNNVPATNYRTTFSITTGTTNTLDFGINSGIPFIRSNSLNIYSGNVKLSGSETGGTGSFALGASVFNYSGGAGSTLQFTGRLGINSSNVPTGYSFAVADNSYMGGKLAIGTTNTPNDYNTGSSGYRLYVAGGILTEKLRVGLIGTGNWADFVFDKSYKLPSLSEVEKFIEANKHLPEVPSAEEVVKNGINVAEMDAKLLQKIEELTLYMIELQKQVKAQQNTINQQQNQIEILKRDIAE